MSRKRRTFDASFKLHVVQMIRDQGLSVGQDLHPHAQWLAISGRGVGLVLTQDCGLGDGAEHDRQTRLYRFAEGHHTAQSARRAACSF